MPKLHQWLKFSFVIQVIQRKITQKQQLKSSQVRSVEMSKIGKCVCKLRAHLVGGFYMLGEHVLFTNYYVNSKLVFSLSVPSDHWCLCCCQWPVQSNLHFGLTSFLLSNGRHFLPTFIFLEESIVHPAHDVSCSMLFSFMCLFWLSQHCCFDVVSRLQQSSENYICLKCILHLLLVY